MDLKKAQRLINKIQAFLDNGNGHNLSRLEKDLIKSYVQQLYEAVTSEESNEGQESTKTPEDSIQKSLEESKSKFQTSRITEIPKAEPPKPVQTEYSAPIPKAEPPVYSEYHAPPVKEEYHATPIKEKHVEFEITKPEETMTHVTEHKQQRHVTEPVRETIHTKHSASQPDQNDSLQKLFDVHRADEMGSRFSHVPIESIESA